jgi:hypothetical protein
MKKYVKTGILVAVALGAAYYINSQITDSVTPPATTSSSQ